MTDRWALGLVLGLLALMAGFSASLFFTLRIRPPATPAETCWKDPHPERSLDFDFYTGIDGKPNRCGFLPSATLPQLRSNGGVNLDLECYPLARIECPK